MDKQIIIEFIQHLNSRRPPKMSPFEYERRAIKGCTMCKNRGEQYPVPIIGDESSEFLIIDSNPGKFQVEEGGALVFKGASFNLLSRILHHMDITFQDCALTYAFHCQTSDRDPISYDRCSLWFHYEISHMPNLKTIITLGEDAFHLIMGNGHPKLQDIYGNRYIVDLEGRKINILPLMHPWFLLRNKEWLDRTVSFVSEISLK